jgi:hypothetical protein
MKRTFNASTELILAIFNCCGGGNEKNLMRISGEIYAEYYLEGKSENRLS